MEKIDELQFTKLYKELELQTEKLQKKKKNPLSKKEIYLTISFKLVFEVMKKLNDLYIGPLLLSSFPIKFKGKIMESEYINYHLDFYFINIVSLYDRILKLINQIYKLGLTNKYVKHEIITSNQNVDKKIINILIDFYKRSIKVRTLQNIIKHQKKYTDDKLSNLGLIEIIIKNKKKETFLNFYNKRLISEYTKNMQKIIYNNNEEIIKFVKQVFNQVQLKKN